MMLGARYKFGASMFETKVFRSKCTVLKKALATLLRLWRPPVIRRPEHYGPLAPIVTPLFVNIYYGEHYPPPSRILFLDSETKLPNLFEGIVL